MIEEFLTQRLKNVSSRVYPNVAPANAPAPLVIYQLVSTQRETVLEGPTGVVTSTFRVNVYAAKFSELVALVRGARLALNGYRGGDIQYVNLVNELDLSDLDKEDPLKRRMLEFRITHTEQ